jgi:hypothetical protein
MCLGPFLLAAPAAAQQTPPAPEQLLASTIHADDLAKLDPGGWWNDVAEFNDRLDPGGGADEVTSVTAHVFGKPDNAPAEVATSLQLYAKAAAATDAFDATAADDARDDGAIVDGPKVGDQSRYLYQAADSEHEGATALRFRFGNYVARIEVGGAASTIKRDQLAELGRMVLSRLRQLDAGKLAVPALPDLAHDLPAADPALPRVLGTATPSSEALSWIWSKQNAALVVSNRLRMLLKEGAGNEQPVLRRYTLAASPTNVADIVVIPFRAPQAASRFLSESKREDARRAAVAYDEGDVKVAPPIPDVAPAYRADIRVGRYVAEVTCLAPFAPTSSVCAAAVKDLAARAMKSLPQK